jgi:hypothetical protein
MPRKAPDHAAKPLDHFRPTKLGSSESLFAPGLRHVEPECSKMTRVPSPSGSSR